VHHAATDKRCCALGQVQEVGMCLNAWDWGVLSSPTSRLGTTMCCAPQAMDGYSSKSSIAASSLAWVPGV